MIPKIKLSQDGFMVNGNKITSANEAIKKYATAFRDNNPTPKTCGSKRRIKSLAEKAVNSAIITAELQT